MNEKILIILPLVNQQKFILKSFSLLESLNKDILIIDDGSTDHTYDLIKEYSWIKYIKHEQSLGAGAVFITAYKYALDFEYDLMITLDYNNILFNEDIARLMENIDYGYDIVNASRILENFNYHDINPGYINITAELSANIKAITNFDITDPLSGIKAIRIDSLKNIDLTEFNHGLFFQLWIQAYYYGLSIIEIPAQSGNSFGEEYVLYEDPLGFFLSIIETERFLYEKKNLN